jgi:hypothetical protein
VIFLKGDEFFHVPKSDALTSEGMVDLPMFFYNVAVRHLNYWVDYERVVPKLEGTGLVPLRFFNGKALISLIFYNYRDVSIGPYDEVAITIVVRPAASKDPGIYLPTFLRRSGEDWGSIGAYVLEMPVTIPQARAAGREIWGFPKFETKIPFRLTGRSFEFEVKDPHSDGFIVAVEGMMGPGVKVRATDLVTYSNLNDSIWKTIIHVDAAYTLCTAKGVDLKVCHSPHRMAQNMRDLGFEGIRPFLVMSSDNFRSRLNPGRAVAPWKTPGLPYLPDIRTSGIEGMET